MADSDAVSAPTDKYSAAQAAAMRSLSPRGALMELESYVRDSAQKAAFGKTRAQAALAVLRDHIEVTHGR